MYYYVLLIRYLTHLLFVFFYIFLRYEKNDNCNSNND